METETQELILQLPDPETFDTFWVDTRGQDWGLKIKGGDWKVYMKLGTKWLPVVTLPLEIISEIPHVLKGKASRGITV